MTNYLVTISLNQARSEEVGEALIENVITKYCTPDYIIMDQDSAFMSSLMNYLFRKLGVKIKTVGPNNHQSLQAVHGIKSLSNILTKHLNGQGQIWHKYLPLATFMYNILNSPNLCNHSPYKLAFGRRPKISLGLEINLDIKVSGTYREYFTLLNRRLQYLQKLLQNFRMKCLLLINKDREFFQYNSGDLVYIISSLASQLRTTSRQIAITYVGPLVIYKIVDPHNYLLMSLDGKLL